MAVPWGSCGSDKLKLKTSFISSIFFVIGIIIIASAFAIDYFTHQPAGTKQADDKPKLQINLPDRQPQISFVSSTEYLLDYDTLGGTIIKLTDWKGDFINTICYETILYPDKSTYLGWQSMIQQPEHGNYYINFTVPDFEGIYDMEIRCLVQNKNISVGKGFHVSANFVNSSFNELVFGEAI